MGGCEAEFEADQCKVPKLPLLNPPTMHSPERSGMKTPPLFTSASVPFGWEEEPGKPRPCTALVTFSNPTPPKCLELPPRLLLLDSNKKNNSSNKLSSPTTVLEGPYPYVSSNNNTCHSPSFRMISEDLYGSFSGERGQLGSMVLKEKDKGWFGSWREKNLKREASGGSHVFPSSVDCVGNVGDTHKNMKSMRKRSRSESFSNPFHAKSSVWTRMYEGLKRVVSGRSKKLKKYACGWP